MDILHNPLQNNIKKSTSRNFSAKKTSIGPLFMSRTLRKSRASALQNAFLSPLVPFLRTPVMHC